MAGEKCLEMRFLPKWMRLIIILYILFCEIQCRKENIKHSLETQEFTKVKFLETHQDIRIADLQINEKCFSIKAFGNEFVMDVFEYFQREDSRIMFISKLKNTTSSLLDTDFIIYEGSVRDIRGSTVLGYFSKNDAFTGYIITDEIYVVEPYGSKQFSVIVYKLTNVIPPHCSKSSGKSFDCSKTSYYDPWIANKPPVIKVPKFKLLYNKHEEQLRKLHEQFMKKLNAEENRRNTIDSGDADSENHHYAEEENKNKEQLRKLHEQLMKKLNAEENKRNTINSGDEDNENHHYAEENVPPIPVKENNDYNERSPGYNRKEKYLSENMPQKNMNQKGVGYAFNGKWGDFIGSSEKSPTANNEVYEERSPAEDSEESINDKKDSENGAPSFADYPKKNDVFDSNENWHNQNKYNLRMDALKDNGYDNTNSSGITDNNDYLRSQNVFHNSSNSTSFHQRRKRNSGLEPMFNTFFENGSFQQALSDMWKSSSYKDYRRKSSDKMKKYDKRLFLSIESEQAKEHEDWQCDVSVAIDPSFLKKFDGDKDAVRNTIIQIMMLNKILRKVYFSKGSKPFLLSLMVSHIILYADEVYNPFSADEKLESFAKKHRPAVDSCLSIGFVNVDLESGELYEGYIPKAGGGACSETGNHIVISAGDSDVPAPMGLLFSSLVRAVTRGLGANDEIDDCDTGVNPNPMDVLQKYFLAHEIQPKKERSIFTACNIVEISKRLKNAKCLHEIFDPLCGNGIVDKDEMCDCGPDYGCGVRDPCCEKPNTELSKQSLKKQGHIKRGCTLIDGATCSMHQDCCFQCNVMPPTTNCFSGHGVCDIAICDGKSAVCPRGVIYSDGLLCSEFNTSLSDPLICKDKKCEKGLCETFHLKPCSGKESTEHECMYCCEKDGECVPAAKLSLMPGRKFYKPNGYECKGGRCQKGMCLNEKGHVMNKIMMSQDSDMQNGPPFAMPPESGCRKSNDVTEFINYILIYYFVAKIYHCLF